MLAAAGAQTNSAPHTRITRPVDLCFQTGTAEAAIARFFTDDKAVHDVTTKFVSSIAEELHINASKLDARIDQWTQISGCGKAPAHNLRGLEVDEEAAIDGIRMLLSIILPPYSNLSVDAAVEAVQKITGSGVLAEIADIIEDVTDIDLHIPDLVELIPGVTEYFPETDLEKVLTPSALAGAADVGLNKLQNIGDGGNSSAIDLIAHIPAVGGGLAAGLQAAAKELVPSLRDAVKSLFSSLGW